MTFDLLRALTTAAAAIGLLVNVREWLAARAIARLLRRADVNGIRQRLANHLRAEQALTVGAQVLLLLAPLCWAVASPSPVEFREPWALAARVCTSAVSVVLATKATIQRAHRLDTLALVERTDHHARSHSADAS